MKEWIDRQITMVPLLVLSIGSTGACGKVESVIAASPTCLI
jgi:hypothetical protein